MHLSWLTCPPIPVDSTAGLCVGIHLRLCTWILTKHPVSCLHGLFLTRDVLFSFFCWNHHHNDPRLNDFIVVITNCLTTNTNPGICHSLCEAFQRTLHFQTHKYQICTDMTERSCDWLTYRLTMTLSKPGLALLLIMHLCFSGYKQGWDESI